jgi:uncharacterized protein YlxW (UPF0749 family)
MMDISTAVAIGVALVGVVVSVLTARQTAKREYYVAIEAARAVVKEEVASLARIIDALRKRVEDLEHEVEQWKLRYQALCNWVRKQGLDPDDHWKEIEPPGGGM